MESTFYNEDQALINEWFDYINAKPRTKETYITSIKQYIEFNGMSLSKLLKEAEDDIRNGVLGRQRKIKHRLIDFKASLSDKSDNTVHSYMSAVRSFYESQEIDMPKQKRYNRIPILKENKFLGMERSEIKRVLKYANVRDKAITLLISSSGAAANELVNITKEDFYNGLDRETGICTFYIRREKTGGDYHTYCTPETSAAIQEYLNTREDDLPWLFVGYIKETREAVKLNTNSVGSIFRRLASKTGNEGEFGFYNKIRSHNFRKFFETTMMEEGCPRWAAEYMMGHKEEMDARYSSPSGEKMKHKYYLPYVNSLMIDTADVIIQPKEDLDALRELQAEMKLMREKESEKDHTISELMKISLELKDRLDSEEVRQEILSQVGTDKSLGEIQEAVKNFNRK